MIRTFRVYQNSANIGSYYNRWIADNSPETTEFVPSASDIPQSNKLTELSTFDLISEAAAFGFKFQIEDEEFLLYSESGIDAGDGDHKGEVDCVMIDVREYIKLNFAAEAATGNMTRLLTQFLAGYFKKYENLFMKQKKINRLKQGLSSMQSLASQTFISIVERGKAIGELKSDLDSISDHGLVFNKKARKLKNKMWSGRARSYVFVGITLLALVVFLNILL